MEKNYFKKKFPDVELQELTTKVVLGRTQVQECVIGLIKSLDTGLLYYDYSNRTIRVFTSDKMKSEIEKMTSGSQVTHPHSGKVGTIISDEPFLICGQMCVTVDFDGNKDSYDCEFFVEKKPKTHSI